MVESSYIEKGVNLGIIGAFVEEGLVRVNPLPDRSGRKEAMGLKGVMKEGAMSVKNFMAISIKAGKFTEGLIFSSFGFGLFVNTMLGGVSGVPQLVPFGENVAEDAT